MIREGLNVRLPGFDELVVRADFLAGKQEWAAAIGQYEAALKLRPGDPHVLLQLSYVHSLSGSYRTAVRMAREAAAASPRNIGVIKELISRLRTFNEGPRLMHMLDNLPPLAELPIPLLLAFANQVSNLNLQERALVLLDEARRADPNYPPTLVARAQVLMYLGRFSAAEHDLQACIRRAPEVAQAWWLISRLRKQSREVNHVDRLRRMLAVQGRRPQDVAMLAYALHKELDDVGDYQGAGDALTVACRAKRSMLNYSAADGARLMERLLGAELDASNMPAKSDGKVPIFIIGMHRSGTTLLEQLLDGHSDIHGIGELYDFTSQMRWATDHHCRGVVDEAIVARSSHIDWADVGARYLDAVAWRLGERRHFTDKLPSNFLNAGFICKALPQAKLLHMVRDPNEVAFSNLRELFSDANPYSYDQLELAGYYRDYLRLMKHWHQRFPGRILDVDYARLTKDPESVIKEVCAFCGLDFQPGMLRLQERTRGVATASAVQVRNTVVALEQPKWLPYRDYLQPFIQAMA